MEESIQRAFLDLEVEGVRLRLRLVVRRGRRPAVLLLHGFGSTKEDFADLASYPGFEDRTIVMYDAPGFGETECSDLSVLSMSFLQNVAGRVLQELALPRVPIVGHSMGGLTALLLSARRGTSTEGTAWGSGRLPRAARKPAGHDRNWCAYPSRVDRGLEAQSARIRAIAASENVNRPSPRRPTAR